MRRRLRPDHEHVGDGRVRDPGLRAGEPIAAVDPLGPRLHAGGVGAGVGLGQAEAADPLAGGELRQVALALGLVAVGVDRVHDEGGLHAHHRAVAGIDPLDLARDEPVGDVGRAGAAVILRQRDAEQPELAHLVEDRAVGLLLAVGLDDARQQLLLRVGARAVADHALVVGELIVEQERVVPPERSGRGGVFGLRMRNRGHYLSCHSGARRRREPGTHKRHLFRIEPGLRRCPSIVALMGSGLSLREPRNDGGGAHTSMSNLTPCASGSVAP